MVSGVRLNVPPDTTLTTLKAEDADINSPPLEYYINNITFTRLGQPDENNVISKALDGKLFQIDVKTGELKTTNLMQTYSDGHFDVAVFANNTQDPAKRSNISVRVSINLGTFS